MSKRILFCFYFFPATVLLFFAGCAVIESPGGGPKDNTPPHAAGYSPDSAVLNFSGKKITIRFDEYIQLSDLRNQLIISPPMNEMPDVQARQKELIIKINDSLRANTTYTINFGNAIRDITENNALGNFRYVFSTGPVIDSLQLGGKIVNAFTNAGEKNVLVILYDTDADSAPYLRKPFYFTKTKDDGSFRLTNLHAGKYKVFGLADANSNYVYDNSDERIAFLDETVNLEKNTDTLKLRMFREENYKGGIKKASLASKGKILIELSAPLKSPSVKPLAPLPASVLTRVEKGIKKDSLIFWFSGFEGDSLRLVVNDAGVPVDTAIIRIPKADAKAKGKGTAEEQKGLSLSANISKGQAFDQNRPIVIYSTTPFSNVDQKKLQLKSGKTDISCKITIDTSNYRRIFISADLNEDSTYTFFIPPGTITDFFGNKNDSLFVPFSLRKYTEYGSIKLTVKNVPPGKHYLLQLLDGKGELLKESALEKDFTISYDLLLSANYNLRMVDDENRNGKWDTGNYLGKKQPEKVMYYSAPLKVRAGWDMDVEWLMK
ncbi:MAG: hypothetical protein FD123_805 [Bacteroidetes bacterium]|nr:MAG: hypothetical protein FD123_805 [Bacteroidota bacterium]